MQEAGRWDHAAEARALAEDLGGLPLALVVAGTLIKETGEAFAAYAGRLGEVLAQVPANEDYPTSVIGAVKLSYDKLEPDAQVVADLCAWWAAEGLEPALLTEAPGGDWWEGQKAEFPEPVQALAADAGRVRAAFGALGRRSLITREGAAWTMHRMTARALRAMQAARADGAPAEAAAALLASVYPGGKSPGHSPQWPLCARLTPHVRALWATGAAQRGAAMEALLNQSALYLAAIADYPGAADVARAGWELTTARLPEADREVAVAEATLGVALVRLGDLTTAEAHLTRAVALDEAHRPGSADLADKLRPAWRGAAGAGPRRGCGAAAGGAAISAGAGAAAAAVRAEQRPRGAHAEQPWRGAARAGTRGGGSAALRRIAAHPARGAAAGGCAAGIRVAEHGVDVAHVRRGRAVGAAVA